MLSFITNGLTGPYWVVYAVEEVGLSAREWGLIMLVEAVLRLGMFLPAGLLVDRWGRTTSLVAALAISALASPLFVVVKGMWAILAVRAVLAVAFTLAIPACTALMADLVPRLLRGQLMAALGQGGIMLGAVGGAGGPALGYLIIPPMMLASLAGGYIYTFNPALPWLLSAAAGFLGVILAVLFIRDPQEAEV
jgi:MFS family permease